MGKALASVGKISKPNDRFWPSRRLQTGNPVATRNHNYHVGAIVHASNHAHAALFLIFCRIAADDDFDLGQDLWHTAGSDQHQRNMLAVVVKNKLKHKKSFQNSIIWAIKALDKLGEIRNDAVHLDMDWYYDQLLPGLATKSIRRKRLEDRPIEKLWRSLVGDFNALSNYLTDLYWSMSQPRPSCRRPRLLLVQSSNARTQKQRRQAKKEAR